MAFKLENKNVISSWLVTTGGGILIVSKSD